MALKWKYARFEAWWMWDDTFVLDAVVGLAFDHWRQSVSATLGKKAAVGLCPAGIPHLGRPEYLARNTSHLYRSIPQTPQNHLGLAVSLSLETGDMHLSKAVWLAKATKWVCGGAVSEHEAEAYAKYRIAFADQERSEPPLETYDRHRRRGELEHVCKLEAELEAATTDAVKSAFLKGTSFFPTLDGFAEAVWKVARVLEETMHKRNAKRLRKDTEARP